MNLILVVNHANYLKQFKAEVIMVEADMHADNLGYFKDIKEAAKCYEDSAKKHYGEFARF